MTRSEMSKKAKYRGGTAKGSQRQEAWINQRRKVSRGSINHKDSAIRSLLNMLIVPIYVVMVLLVVFLEIPVILILELLSLLPKVRLVTSPWSPPSMLTQLRLLNGTILLIGLRLASSSKTPHSSLDTTLCNNPLEEEEEYLDEDLCMRHEHESKENW